MRSRPRVAVVGLGALGSMALWRLAARGADVVGIEQFPVGHVLGSTHGHTRLFRVACLEHPALVPLARRSGELFRELSALSGRELLTVTGGVMIGTENSRVITGTLTAAREGGVAVREMTSAEVRGSFPQHVGLTPDDVGVFDEEAGIGRPEASVTAAVDAAVRAGARVLGPTRVTGVDPDGSGVTVRTAAGTLRVDQVVVAAGAWLGGFVPGLPLRPLRTPMTWFEAAPGYGIDTFPVFIRQYTEDLSAWGHGAIDGHGVKVGPGDDAMGLSAVDPDRVERGVSPADWELVGRVVGTYLSGISPVPVRVTACMITRTPDGQFVVGRAPGAERVVVAGGDSGHAFKHAPGIGELLAQIVVGEQPFQAVSFMAPGRFGGSG